MKYRKRGTAKVSIKCFLCKKVYIKNKCYVKDRNYCSVKCGRKGRQIIMIGYKFSESRNKKISETRKRLKLKAPKNGRIFLKGNIPWNKGKKFLQLSLENHPNWQGGKSFEPYGLEFNKDLKEVIRNRDKYKCKICEIIESDLKRKLSIHHIDYNKQNNNPNNLISLCLKCHIKTNYNRDNWKIFFKNIWKV